MGVAREGTAVVGFDVLVVAPTVGGLRKKKGKVCV